MTSDLRILDAGCSGSRVLIFFWCRIHEHHHPCARNLLICARLHRQTMSKIPGSVCCNASVTDRPPMEHWELLQVCSILLYTFTIQNISFASQICWFVMCSCSELARTTLLIIHTMMQVGRQYPWKHYILAVRSLCGQHFMFLYSFPLHSKDIMLVSS